MASSDGDLSEIFKKSCNVGVSAKQAGKTTMTTANLTKWFKVSYLSKKAPYKRNMLIDILSAQIIHIWLHIIFRSTA